MGSLTGLLGILVLLGLALLASENRRAVPWKTVVGGLALQLVLAYLLLRFPLVAVPFEWLSHLITGVIARADAGIVFLFGPNLANPGGPWGFVFLIRVLPVIVFFASLMAVLYYLGVMQRLVAALAWVLRRTLGVSGAEAMAMAANVFVGQTEAPLCVRPFIPKMTRAQLMTLMVGGFATMAGSVLFAYVTALGGTDPEQQAVFVKHLLTASLMSAPAAFVMARVIVPETSSVPDEDPEALARATREVSQEAHNVLDAAASGASEGLKLALNVGAMLIAFVSLLALVSWPIEALGEVGPIAAWRERVGFGPFTLEAIFGWILAPLAWSMGVPWAEAPFFGSLLGQKLVVTEFVAYDNLAKNAEALSPRTVYIATYALCGFANFPSIAIQIGGLSTLAPSRRSEIASLALRAMLGGVLASWITACVAGLLL